MCGDEGVLSGKTSEADEGRLSDVAATGHGGQEGRLIDDDEVRILMEDGELEGNGNLLGGDAIKPQVLAGMHQASRRDGASETIDYFAPAKTGIESGEVIGWVAVVLPLDHAAQPLTSWEWRLGGGEAHPGGIQAIARGQGVP